METSLFYELLSIIFNHIDNAICVTDKNGTLRYTNPAANKLLGIDPETDKGKKIWDFIPTFKRNDDIRQVFIDGISNKQTTQQALVDFVNNGKKLYRLWLNLTYVDEEDGKFVIDMNDMTMFLKINDAFTRYTSPQIANYVLNTPMGDKQGGDSKMVSILISDLRGFTAISAEMEPTPLIKLLNRYFEKMVEVIERFDGTVIEFLGDGIFVVFGAPKEDENHAEKAVVCAIEMQNAMAEVNEWNRKHKYPELEMGIGINSGPAVVGNIGSKQKMKYGAMGYTVNLAGRVEGFTVGGQVLITKDTRDMIRERVVIGGEQTILPKGGTDKLKLYEVIGIGNDHVLMQTSQDISWHMLSAHKKVKIYPVENKIVQENPHTVSLTAISENRHYALLHTRIDLNVNDNIMIRSAVTTYAKVIGKEDDNYIISFTMRPEGFSEWINSL